MLMFVCGWEGTVHRLNPSAATWKVKQIISASSAPGEYCHDDFEAISAAAPGLEAKYHDMVILLI